MISLRIVRCWDDAGEECDCDEIEAAWLVVKSPKIAILDIRTQAQYEEENTGKTWGGLD